MPDVVAYPFVRVQIDTSALTPIAQRAPNVIAIVGSAAAFQVNGANIPIKPLPAGNASADPDIPFHVSNLDDAAALFGAVADGNLNRSPLYNALEMALLQDPGPSKVYGVAIGGDGVGAALAALEGASDVTFVALAGEAGVAPLTALKNHVENMSAGGQKRLGVAMVDTTTAKSATYAADVAATYNDLKSGVGRMVLVAARGATRTDVLPNNTLVRYPADVASAAMAAMAGYPPHVSVLMKKVRGFNIPVAQQYSPSEIIGLSEREIIPVIDPALIPGESLHFAEGCTFSTDAALGYVDIVRVLDDIDFRLKAGLIGQIGDTRITRSGMQLLKTQIESILDPLLRGAVIDAYDIRIPLLEILNVPEAARSPGDNALVAAARANRQVDARITVTYGPAIHRLELVLAPKF
jgi:Phage tail sheath protein.